MLLIGVLFSDARLSAFPPRAHAIFAIVSCNLCQSRDRVICVDYAEALLFVFVTLVIYAILEPNYCCSLVRIGLVCQVHNRALLTDALLLVS